MLQGHIEIKVCSILEYLMKIVAEDGPPTPAVIIDIKVMAIYLQPKVYGIVLLREMKITKRL